VWCFFLKFQPREFLNSMQDGCIYMNPVSYFKKNDYAKLHLFDKFENTNIYLQNAKMDVIQKDQIIHSSIVHDVAITYGQQHSPLTHIWCCFHVKKGSPIRGDNKIFSDDMWEFGDQFLLITNTDKFIERIFGAIRRDKLSSKADSVSYIAKAPVIKDMNIFCKFDNYSYQQEYRIGIKASDEYIDKAYKLEIGSIHDISIIMNKSKVKNFVNNTTDARGLLSILEF